MADAHSTVTYKDIPGFPGYRVGDDGSVWSCRRQIGLGQGRGTRAVIGDVWKQMKPVLLSTGYLNVELSNGTPCRWNVHRLVMAIFVGPCPEGMECCHNDGNPANNALPNLRWDTRKANQADSLKHGTKKIGERHPRSKLTVNAVRSIRADYANGVDLKGLATKYGIHKCTALDVIKGRTWTHVV